MGQLQFLTAGGGQLSQLQLATCHLIDIEGYLRRVQITQTDDGFVVDDGFEQGESPNCLSFQCLWPVEGLGPQVLGTPALVEWPRPMDLAIELARGTISRLRKHVAAWQLMADQSPDEQSLSELKEITHQFVAAIAAPRGSIEAAKLAAIVINRSAQLIDQIGSQLPRLVLDQHCSGEQRLSIFLGGELPHGSVKAELGEPFCRTFHAAMIPVDWNRSEPAPNQFDWKSADERISWALAHDLSVCVGPLVDFCGQHLPAWLTALSTESADLHRATVRYVEAAAKMVQNRANLWYVGANINASCDHFISEADQLRMTVTAMETLRRVSPGSSTVLGIDQPWGEYQLHRKTQLTPYQCADAMIRACDWVSGIVLQIHLGHIVGGTLPRDLEMISRQIDEWSTLGKPLLLELSLPSNADVSLAGQPIEDEVESFTAGEKMLERQSRNVENLVMMLLSKPTIQGIIWRPLLDTPSSLFPAAGLFDINEKPKPALEVLARICGRYLAPVE